MATFEGFLVAISRWWLNRRAAWLLLLRSLRGSYWGAKDFADRAKEENQQLRSDLKDYGILRKFLGPAKTDELIQQAKDAEVVTHTVAEHLITLDFPVLIGPAEPVAPL